MTNIFGHTHRLGGLKFCGCHLLPVFGIGPAGGGAAAPGKAPVVIKGRQAKVIDTHTHCLFQASLDLMGEDAPGILPPTKGVAEHFLAQPDPLKFRLEDMDRMGVDMQVLSVNPFWYKKDRETAQAICKINNESLAELIAQHPRRFAAFASICMQFPDLAVQQLEEAVKKYGLVGAAIG
ncbi:MAG: amidohydrolase family protein, partial [Limnohabitans sp.]